MENNNNDSSNNTPKFACAFFLCIEELEAVTLSPLPAAEQTPQDEPQIQRFRHTRQRVARRSMMRRRHRRTVSRNPALNEEEDETDDLPDDHQHHHDGDDEEDEPCSPLLPRRAEVDARVERARQRRAKLLQAKALKNRQAEDHRSKVEALEQERSEFVADRIAAKLELAAKRREEQLQSRNAANSATEQIRLTRLNQARIRKAVSLIQYAVLVQPIFDVFRGCGLHLQGARTTSEVEEVLLMDPLAPCSLCCPEPGAAPTVPVCPKNGKRHSKNLVALSECFLRATSDVRHEIYAERVRHCTEDSKAKPSNKKRGHGEGHSSSSADPIGLPHFLPLAFHEACGFRACVDDAKLFAARNVILQLEEIASATSCVAHDYYCLKMRSVTTRDAEVDAEGFTTNSDEIQNIFEKAQEEELEFGATSNNSTPPAAAAEELLSKCSDLGMSLMRFVHCWVQFGKKMRQEQVEDASQSREKSEAAKYKLGQQMIQSYIQLAVTQNMREEDVQRRQDMISRGTCPTPLKNREKMVSARREELTSAIDVQMRQLRKAIELAGLLEDLEEQLEQVMEHRSGGGESSTCCYSSSSCATTPSKTPAQRNARFAPKAAVTDDYTSASCGMTCSSADPTPMKGAGPNTAHPQGENDRKVAPRAPVLPHLNSADWCDGDLCVSDTEDFTTPERVRATTAAQPKVKTTSARSSSSFRAQLAADRRRIRSQRAGRSTKAAAPRCVILVPKKKNQYRDPSRTTDEVL